MTPRQPIPAAPDPLCPSTQSRRRGIGLALALVLGLAVAGLFADWWVASPSTVPPTFVGRERCSQCHATQANAWHGSDHDLAMDHATPQTVLGDFNDATIEHHGVESRMFRQGDRYWVSTEGPDGELHDYPVKYVFGVRPLQQYLVELGRTADQPANEEARLQVLRISWDVERKAWFHLDPPDVEEKLAPDDPLHWTGSAQNWNHMCANCHSTNLHKNFSEATRTYHTTFSELDVSCEACHGPGSLHVQLAESRSLFWDRVQGYGLRRLKGESSLAQIETCAACHSRRSTLSEEVTLTGRYHDRFDHELLRPETYYADGQVRDEVYVYGSFLQSKMYDKGIRCTDCHDPHTTRPKAEGNALCTNCHQHPAAKYDSPSHHHHAPGSPGSLCVECHMPATPFMDVDLRRDHSIRVPRPDLSRKWNTPNACTGCHVDVKQLPLETQAQTRLLHYSDWLEAARQGDAAVQQELNRLNDWAAATCRSWYGDDLPQHFADAFGPVWRQDPESHQALVPLVSSVEYPAIVRASALALVAEFAPDIAAQLAEPLLSHRDPLLRTTAVRSLGVLTPQQRKRLLTPRLSDTVRLVRQEAAVAMADLPLGSLQVDDQRAFHKAIAEYQGSLAVNNDLAGSHLMLGVLAERQNRPQDAERAYQTAIHVQPDVAGPRSNLAQLYESLGQPARVEPLRAEELELMARDAKLAPRNAIIQYRYGMALYLNQQPEAALAALELASNLEPRNLQFHLAVAYLLQRLGQTEAALTRTHQILQLSPNHPDAVQLRNELTNP